MCAQRQAVCTMTHQGRWEISLGSRSTFAESMERRSGNATNARRSMLFNQIGKRIPRLVALESIDVTVVPFSQGNSTIISRK